MSAQSVGSASERTAASAAETASRSSKFKATDDVFTAFPCPVQHTFFFAVQIILAFFGWDTSDAPAAAYFLAGAGAAAEATALGAGADLASTRLFTDGAAFVFPHP